MQIMSEISRKKTGFDWDEVRLKAAELIAKGENRESIAKSLGIADRTIRRWGEHPEFRRKIDEIIQDIDIAQKAERIKIAKKEIQRVRKRLELDEDHPTSRDLVALLRYVGEEIGDFEPKRKLEIGVKIIDNIPKDEGEDGNSTQ